MPDVHPPRVEGTSVLAADARFKGEAAFDGSMKIEGRFEGKIQSRGQLAVAKGAEVSAEIHVGQLHVDGSMQGSVVAGEKIELSSSARVTGDLKAPRLVVSEGATLVGNLTISPEAAKTAAAAPTAKPPVHAEHPERIAEPAGARR